MLKSDPFFLGGGGWKEAVPLWGQSSIRNCIKSQPRHLVNLPVRITWDVWPSWYGLMFPSFRRESAGLWVETTLTTQAAISQKKCYLDLLEVFHHLPVQTLTTMNFALAISLSLLSPNYCCLWPWEGSRLTHWVPSNGFDPLLWPWPSVSVGVVMREKCPLVSAPIPSHQCMSLDSSNLVSAFRMFDLVAFSLLMLA